MAVLLEVIARTSRLGPTWWAVRVQPAEVLRAERRLGPSGLASRVPGVAVGD